MTAAAIQAVLTQTVRLPATSQRPGSMKSLLLDPAQVAANNASAPLGVQFTANSLPNQIPLLWWLLLVELLGIVSFPLAFVVFPGLRDRGWGLAKLLGLLVLAYLVWLPSSLRLLPFDAWVVDLAFAALALAGAAVAWWRREALWAFVRAHWRLLVVCELGFLAAFLFFTWIRALDPDLWHIYRGGEKPMEMAYLDAILRSRYMPPADPWFAGGSINYYYYGQFLIAILIKLTGVAPATAFNLAIPLLFALSFTAAFSVVAGLTGRAWAGLAAGLALVVVGNLDGLWQLFGQWQALLTHQPLPAFDYWRSSRVIPCLGVQSTPQNPCYDTTINEFPYWSFLYADLHAHLIGLPVTVFLIGGCASLLGSVRAQASRWRSAVPTLAALALALGAAWCINTWDLPTYTLLIGAALALGLLLPTSLLTRPLRGEGNQSRQDAGGPSAPLDFTGEAQPAADVGAQPAAPAGDGETSGSPFPHRERGWGVRSLLRAITWPAMRNYIVALVAVVGAAYALYAPFHAHFQNFVSGIGQVTTPTAPYQFVTLFGIWLFLTASYFFVELRDRWERIEDRLMAQGRLPLLPPAYRLWAQLGIFALVLVIGFLLSLKLLLFALIAAGLFLALDRRAWADNPAKLMTYCLLLLGLAVALGVELVYVRDFLDNSPYERMNTVFKFYYQVWTLLALGGALAFVFLVDRRATATDPRPFGSPRAAGRGAGGEDLPRFAYFPRLLWVAALIALLFGSSVFLVEGTQARLQDPLVWAAVQPPPGGIQPQVLSLDGMAYMRGWYPYDYEAITWMNQHIGGMPTIVEASSGVYNWHGRVSVYTGLPDVVQLGHENEQRYGNLQPYGDQVGARQQDVEGFWSTADPVAALNFLREYDVQYVYLGALERTCYIKLDSCVALSQSALDKFGALQRQGALRPVYSNPDVVIYQVVG
jgi:YYY domain-containing protein